MRLVFILVIMALYFSCAAQSKLHFDLNVGVLKSVGKDIIGEHQSEIYNLGYIFPSSRKFQHPYFNVLGHVSYPLTDKMNVGLQSGFYFHYYEQYFSNVERTTLSLPIMVTISYKLFNLKSNHGGIEIAAGHIFFHINESLSKMKNGNLYNLTAYYQLDTRSIFKFGVEKQVDNVTLIPFQDEYPGESYQYKLNRIALVVSYGYRFGK